MSALSKAVSPLLLLLLLLPLTGCGKEVGRVSFSSDGRSAATLPLRAGAVLFWTDLDVQYEGAPSLEYQIDLKQAGQTVASATCEPLGPKSVSLMWLETQHGATHSQRGKGKMSCSAQLEKGGLTTVEATLAFTALPTAVNFTRADLVLRQ